MLVVSTPISPRSLSKPPPLQNRRDRDDEKRQLLLQQEHSPVPRTRFPKEQTLSNRIIIHTAPREGKDESDSDTAGTWLTPIRSDSNSPCSTNRPHPQQPRQAPDLEQDHEGGSASALLRSIAVCCVCACVGMASLIGFTWSAWRKG